MKRRINMKFLAVVAVLTTGFSGTALATRIDTRVRPQPEPWFNHSFVRDSLGNIVARDFTYAADVGASVFGAVDIVMGQCYGGGFLNDIAMQPKPYTFASASDWQEPAWARDFGVFGAGGNRTVDDFPRAWRDSASMLPAASMLDNFGVAVSGSGDPWKIPRDPYAPPGLGGIIEHPQYVSSDLMIPGPNDLRTLGDWVDPETGDVTSRQFIILVNWDKPEEYDRIGLGRFYQSLTVGYGLNPGQIAVLDPIPAGIIGPFPQVLPSPLDRGGIGVVPVDAPNDRNSWLGALAGNFFNVQPTENDRLFVLNLGHGSHLWENEFGFEYILSGPRQEANWHYDRIRGFSTLIPNDSETGLITTFRDENGNLFDVLQLAFWEDVPRDAELFVNGQSFGTVGEIYATGTGEVLPLAPVLDEERLLQIAFQVPYELIDSSDIMSIRLILDDGINLNDRSMLVAASLRGGRQEYLSINQAVPSPGSAFLFTVGILAMAIVTKLREISGNSRDIPKMFSA